MKPLLLTLSPQTPMHHTLLKQLSAEEGKITYRHFPDGESFVKVETNCENKNIILLAPLFKPDDKILPLIFISETVRELGAKSIGLISPYLPYMRQDKRFHKGEGVSSRYFSKIISNYFNWIVTVDPHLHRYHSLDEIYSIPTQIVHAAPYLSDWIKSQAKNPLLIGPDSESEQWVADVAQRAKAPYVILTKVRHGDTNVDVSIPDVEKWSDHTPILIDDIISTGKTMIQTIKHLKNAGMSAPICIGVHGIFANNAYEALLHEGAREVVTCNSIIHSSNRIDLSPGILKAIEAMLPS